MAVSREDYRAQLHALLPGGAAWPRGRGTTLDRLVEALAGEYARIDGEAEGLLDEIDPRMAGALLVDWERLLGLPDPCSPASVTFAERRAAAHRKLINVIDGSLASLIATAAGLGYTARIVEHDQATADAIPNLDTTGGKWRFVWWMYITDEPVRYRTVTAGVDEALATYPDTSEVACRIRTLIPAHTLPVFATEVAA